MNKIQMFLFTIVGLLIATASWAVTVKVNTMTNGSVVASRNNLSTSSTNPINVNSAEVITLTVSPASGYYLKTLTVTPYGGAGSGGARITNRTSLLYSTAQTRRI